MRGARPGKYPLRAHALRHRPRGRPLPGAAARHASSRAGRRSRARSRCPRFPLAARPAPGRSRGSGSSRSPTRRQQIPPLHFTIDDQFYDHNRIDTTVTLGDAEEWTLRNTSTELHVFHIHQTDFQVVDRRRGAALHRLPGHRDAAVRDEEEGRSRAGRGEGDHPLHRPGDRRKFVYHCHIAQHADQGMMANIEVVAPGTIAAATSPPHQHHP